MFKVLLCVSFGAKEPCPSGRLPQLSQAGLKSQEERGASSPRHGLDPPRDLLKDQTSVSPHPRHTALHTPHPSAAKAGGSPPLPTAGRHCSPPGATWHSPGRAAAVRRVHGPGAAAASPAALVPQPLGAAILAAVHCFRVGTSGRREWRLRAGGGGGGSAGTGHAGRAAAAPGVDAACVSRWGTGRPAPPADTGHG